MNPEESQDELLLKYDFDFSKDDPGKHCRHYVGSSNVVVLDPDAEENLRSYPVQLDRGSVLIAL
ncbi:MAG: hypothetical protein ACRER2_06165 [Methylococcales bacterium]